MDKIQANKSAIGVATGKTVASGVLGYSIGRFL